MGLLAVGGVGLAVGVHLVEGRTGLGLSGLRRMSKRKQFSSSRTPALAVAQARGLENSSA